MSKIASDIKVGCDILMNKIMNIKNYEKKHGIQIIPELAANIKDYDDIFAKSLNLVNLHGCGGEQYLNDEITSVTSIYNDLLNKINSSNVGCGEEEEMDYTRDFVKDISSFKNNLMNMLSKTRNPPKTSELKHDLPSLVTNGTVALTNSRDKAKSKTKKASKAEPRKKGVSKTKTTLSKKPVKVNKNNIIF